MTMERIHRSNSIYRTYTRRTNASEKKKRVTETNERTNERTNETSFRNLMIKRLDKAKKEKKNKKKEKEKKIVTGTIYIHTYITYNTRICYV